MTATRLCAWKNRSFNTAVWQDGPWHIRRVWEHLTGTRKFMRPVRVRLLQESCLHASTGKAQAYCSLEQRVAF